MRELPLPARIYLLGSYLLGLAALAWLVLPYMGVPTRKDWLLAAGLTVAAAAAQLFVVQRARSSHSDNLTPGPLFAAFLLLPSPLLALTIVLTFLPEWAVYRRRWFIQTFNIASWLIAAALGRATLFLWTDHFQLERLFPLPAAAVAATMLVVLGSQTLLLAWTLKLARGHSLREGGLFGPAKLLVEVALLCLGWAFAAAWLADPLYGIAAAVPLVLVFQALHVPNLKEEAATDPKTGLANMRHFNVLVERDLDRAERSGQPVSLLMCDLDYLRNINNTYGHQAGDVVLRGVADIIRHTIRACDVAGRFGGEEFVVLLADTDGAGAQQVAERLRSEIEQARFEAPVRGQPIGATISIGVASFPADGRTSETLLREADLAVYQAKRAGRNRVVAAGRASRELAAEWAREHLLPVARPSPPGDSRMPLWRFISDATRLSVAVQAQPPVTVTRATTPAAPAPQAASQQEAPRPGPTRWVGVFIAAVLCAGLLGLLPGHGAMARLAASLSLPEALWHPVAIFGALTIVAEHLAITIDQRRGKISVSAVAVLGASFLYGEPGILATVLVLAVWAKMRAHSPLHRMLFNLGNALLAAEGATWTFRLFAGGPLAETPFYRLLLPALAAGLVYYAINHALLCCVRALAEHRRPWQVWLADYHWLWPHYAVFGGVGLVVAAGYAAFGWAGVLALTAPVAMMQLAMQQYTAHTAVTIAELRRLNARLQDSYEATLLALTRALDTRDEETEAHSQRVKRYTELIARRSGVPEAELEHIARGALLHDVGKIGVPDAILLKPGGLSEAERALMQKHPMIGYSMIAHIPFLARAAEVLLYHHEAYDGSGYPSGLVGEQIPHGARIFAIVDALDAITCDRPYRRARSYAEALAEIDRCRGKQFDPAVVDALQAVPLDELEAVARGEHAVPGQQNTPVPPNEGAGQPHAQPSGQPNGRLHPRMHPAAP